jgi:hypothetical protein
MENENEDVNNAPESEEQGTDVSEDVENSDAVDREVYEKVREDMRSERKAKREAQAKAKELEERLTKLEQTRKTTGGDPRLDVLYLVNKDPFVKDNLDIIEQKMEENPEMDVRQALSAVKAELFDRIQKEISAEPNQLPKQEKPTATQEQISPELTGDTLKDALDGKIDMPPEQLAAMKRVLGK